MLFQDVIVCVANLEIHKVSYFCCVVALCMLTVSLPFVILLMDGGGFMVHTVHSSFNLIHQQARMLVL